MADARGSALIARLDASEARLRVLAAEPLPGGETQPSPGGEETWTAAQVWGHLGEFPAFWAASATRVLAAPADAPASFGRAMTDPSRVAPLEIAGSVPVSAHLAACVAGLVDARALIDGLSGTDWDRVGIHVVRGEMSVASIMETTLGNHLEEHVQQLERLAAAG